MRFKTFVVSSGDNCLKMKKPAKKYTIPKEGELNVENSLNLYPSASTDKLKPVVKQFTYKDFKKIADLTTLTVKQWADILHISERTLQRYAKDKAGFSGMQIERILLMEKMIRKGIEMFGKEGFSAWLYFRPLSLQFQKPADQLGTYEGIQEIINTLGRIQHGIPA
ncbi:MAG: hypothetical protein JNJ58_05900 [Chitinophagaceae bacterium]|nr:hypothetical protein [Chitinophagaceae bacterium]